MFVNNGDNSTSLSATLSCFGTMNNEAHYMDGVSYQMQNMTSTGQASTNRLAKHITHSSRSNLCILYFNARSLYPKLDELRVLCDSEKQDTVCITETWFCEDILSRECDIPGNQCI